jgi:phosphoglycerate kinase
MGGQLTGIRRMQDADVAGKTVLVRVDYNVPLQGPQITDDERIRASIPTLEALIRREAKLVLITHLGRPEGKPVPELCLEPVAERLETLLGRPVRRLADCVGPEVALAIEDGEPGDVFLLENVRFHREETTNESAFARELASLGNLFVNDAFATLHRAHASTVGVTDHLPAYAGLLMQRELEALSRLTDDPERPYLAIVGGKKAQSKLGPLRDLLPRVDAILIGGGVAFAFLRAMEASAGPLGAEEELFEEITALVRAARERGVELELPQDAVLAREADPATETRLGDARSIPAGWRGLDIGPETVLRFQDRIRMAKTIIWTGPMGVFELEPFSAGTRGIAEAVAEADAFAVIGGGETGEVVKKLGLAERVSYVSTGGGACLAYLRGKSMPALEALRE